MSETKSLNIYQKMLQATMNIDRVKKGLTIEAGKTKDGKVRTYKAVSEGDVLNAVKPIEIELGIFSYPVKRTLLESSTLVNVTEYNGNTRERKEQFMRVETVFRFVNVDNPTEWVEVTTYGDGIDSGDKAPGKAMTYADKYALLKAYKIETGDDPDQEASKEYAVKKSPITENQAFLISQAIGTDTERLAGLLKYFNVKSTLELTQEQASEAISILGKGKK